MTSFAEQQRAIEARALAHERRMLDATRAILESWGDQAQLYMRADAPWSDRTGRARYGDQARMVQPQQQALDLAQLAATRDERGLAWVPIHPASIYDGGMIALISDAPYGIYLETARGAAYAIIMPTVAQRGPQLLAQLRELWQ